MRRVENEERLFCFATQPHRRDQVRARRSGLETRRLMGCILKEMTTNKRLSTWSLRPFDNKQKAPEAADHIQQTQRVIREFLILPAAPRTSSRTLLFNILSTKRCIIATAQLGTSKRRHVMSGYFRTAGTGATFLLVSERNETKCQVRLLRSVVGFGMSIILLPQ